MHMLFFSSFVDEAVREKLAPFSALSGNESYQSRDLEKVSLLFLLWAGYETLLLHVNVLLMFAAWYQATRQVAKSQYDVMVQPTTLIPKQVDMGVMFSYGSGLTATMFSFQLREGHHPFSLSNIANVMNISGNLWSRPEVSLLHNFL